MARSSPQLPGQLGPGLIIAAAVLIADQGSKIWANAALAVQQPVALLPVLDLRLSYNPGAAFSLFADQGGWQRWFLSALAVAVSGYLVWWLGRLKPGTSWHLAGLSAILGGAVGNVVDRVAYGHVIDFIDIHYRGWHYPAFNLADSAITVGVALLLIAMFREPEAVGG